LKRIDDIFEAQISFTIRSDEAKLHKALTSAMRTHSKAYCAQAILNDCDDGISRRCQSRPIETRTTR